MSEPIKARMVRTSTECYISDCFASCGYDYQYHSGRLKDLYFDGEKPIPSFKMNWLVIKKFPTEIKTKVSGHAINKRYEIIDPDIVSGKYPSVIMEDDFGKYRDEDGDFKYSALYNYKYDMSEPTFEDVEIEWDFLLDIDNFEKPPTIEFKGFSRRGWNDEVYKITNADVNHQGLDQILFPDILIHNRPCSFTSKQVYDITRQYIRENIDGRVAKITSDYDFCFTVKKLIPMYEPKVTQYQNLFARAKKERNKIHTRIQKFKECEIFEMTHDQKRYEGYSVIPAMFADNEQELKTKMQNWLDELIATINAPMIPCSHCHGTGFTDEWVWDK